MRLFPFQTLKKRGSSGSEGGGKEGGCERDRGRGGEEEKQMEGECRRRERSSGRYEYSKEESKGSGERRSVGGGVGEE